MKGLGQDLRYGIRMLLQNPGFYAVAVITLALGIGANTAIFSVVHAVLLKPLPYANADRIAMVWETNLHKGWNSFAVSPPNFVDWQRQSRTFDLLVAFQTSQVALTGEGEPELLSALRATSGFFDLSGVPPILGRPFRPEEFTAGSNQVAILSHSLWRSRFAEKREALGKSILLGGESHQVIGVLPEGFRLPTGADLITPLVFTPQQLEHRGSHFIVAMGRLRSGIPLEQAKKEMDRIAADLARQYPDTNTHWGASVVPLYEEIVGGVRPALLALYAAVGFVLLIACGNVTNLLLARGTSRRREIAVRAALGAGRLRLARQLLTESVLLALAAGALGLLIGQWGLELLRTLQPAGLPRMQNLAIDGSVLLYTTALSVLTGLLFGAAPAFFVSHSSLHDTLKEGGRVGAGADRHRIRGALVVVEVALSLVLLVGAGLEVRSFLHLMRVDPGFNPSNVLMAHVTLPDQKYPTPEQRVQFFERALDGIQALPGVKSAAVVSAVPFGDRDLIFSVEVEGRSVPSGENPSANWYSVSPAYFRLLGIPVLRGRGFTDRDTRDAPRVALINETMARRMFPGEDAIGKRIRMGIDSDTAREIVGIVRDVKHYGLESDVTLQMYEPFRQMSISGSDLLLQADSNPAALAPAARRAIFAVDPDQPVSDVGTLESWVEASASQRRFTTLLIGLFAGVALILAAVGLYGVTAYSVAQRTHEIGLRMALGARRVDVFRLVLRQGVTLILAGIVLGLAGAGTMTRLISRLLYGVPPLDPLTFATTPLILAAVALAACYFPARRATRVDPMTALRVE